jgi:hypothetical protein
MEYEIRQIKKAEIQDLSRFLIEGFDTPCGTEFAEPDVLIWKIFDLKSQIGLENFIVCIENDKILACIGICRTQLTGYGIAAPISAGHGIDWFAKKSSLYAGLMVGEISDKSVDVQFSIGGTEKAIKLKKSLIEWEFLNPIPVMRKALKPISLRYQIPDESSVKRAGRILREFYRLVTHPVQRPREQLRLEPVDHFGEEIHEIVRRCNMPQIHSVRTAELINHFLRYPKGNITGYRFMQDSCTRGFALLSVVQNGLFKVGKIVDLFVDCLDLNLWHTAIYLLGKKLSDLSADIAVCFGSSSLISNALRLNGFYCSGSLPFAIRDPYDKLPRDAKFYLTHIEGDHAYL